MKLLHIAASPKSEEQSSGKRVANAFVDAYLKKHEQVQFRYIGNTRYDKRVAGSF